MKKVLTILICIITYTVNAQEINKNNLKKKWYLKNYTIENQNYKISKKEKDDYIDLKNTMLFKSVSEGKEDTGTWLVNTNGQYIIMKDNKNEKIKAYIKSLTINELVLEFDIKEVRGVNAVYTTNKP